MTHHQGQVWGLIINIALGEANSSDQLFGYVDYSTDFDLDLFSFLMEFKLRQSHLLLVASNEKCSYMITCWELPRANGILGFNHALKVSRKLLWLSSLLEDVCEE